VGCNPENGVKRRHWVEPTIETEHVFIEIGLQVFGLDPAMMRPLDPSFQIAENEMDHGQVRFGLVRVTAERQGLMMVSHLRKVRVASPAIGAQRGTKRNVVFDKAGKRVRTAVGHNAKPQSSCIDAASVLLAIVLTRPNLYRSDHNRLVVSAPTFASSLAADQAFVNFDRILATDSVALGTNHAGAKLVKYLESSLITRECKLPLELNSRLAGDLRGHKIRSPKPCRERRVAGLHDGSSRQRRISFATTAAQHYRRASCETIRIAANAAFRTCKSIRPANGLKVASAGRIVGEHPLKFRKGSGEAANVHG
jgi:hypothetical protein